ncbi:MAG: cyclic nucleotide-binding domain-containing protein [Pseudomonadota bacterium]|nr:cyclic nucleotide-binding domain-containing protein [Pseudomonadota bacterium]
MNAQTDFINFLQTVPTFAEFRPAELAVLNQAMIVDEYPDGHIFVGENRRGGAVYLIVEGKVVATHKRARMRGVDIYEELGPGDLFGLVSLIDHRHEWATYRAVGPVVAASLPYNVFDLLFTANAPIAHHFQNLIALQLAHDLRACAEALAEEFIRNRQAAAGKHTEVEAAVPAAVHDDDSAHSSSGIPGDL